MNNSAPWRQNTFIAPGQGSCHSQRAVLETSRVTYRYKVQVTLRVEVSQLEEDHPVLYWTSQQN